MPDEIAQLPSEHIAEICRRNHVHELSLFGLALTERFNPTSDLDLLVVFDPDAEIGFLALAKLQRELSALAQRPVDLVPKAGLKAAIRDAVLVVHHDWICGYRCLRVIRASALVKRQSTEVR